MKPKQFEAITLVNRLFGYYLRKGMSPDSALQQVESKLGAPYASAVETVKHTVVDERMVQTNNATSSLMASLSKDVREFGGNSQEVALNTSQNLHKAAVGFKSCSRFFSSLYRYPMVILFVSICIYLVYKVFVFPQMVTALGEFDRLPTLTKAVFSPMSGILIFVAVVILIAVSIFQIWQLRRAFATYQPVSSGLGRLTSTDQHQRYLLFLVYLISLLKSGLKPVVSIERAKKYAKIEGVNTQHYEAHQKAFSVMEHENLDLVEEEASFQFDDVLNGLDSVLAAKQEKILFMFQSFIFIFVGLLVIAMYLPIFQLGSVA